jgi:chemotaxis protein histidine kinase CheA
MHTLNYDTQIEGATFGIIQSDVLQGSKVILDVEEEGLDERTVISLDAASSVSSSGSSITCFRSSDGKEHCFAEAEPGECSSFAGSDGRQLSVQGIFNKAVKSVESTVAKAKREAEEAAKKIVATSQQDAAAAAAAAKKAADEAVAAATQAAADAASVVTNTPGTAPFQTGISKALAEVQKFAAEATAAATKASTELVNQQAAFTTTLSMPKFSFTEGGESFQLMITNASVAAKKASAEAAAAAKKAAEQASALAKQFEEAKAAAALEITNGALGTSLGGIPNGIYGPNGALPGKPAWVAPLPVTTLGTTGAAVPSSGQIPNGVMPRPGAESAAAAAAAAAAALVGNPGLGGIPNGVVAPKGLIP